MPILSRVFLVAASVVFFTSELTMAAAQASTDTLSAQKSDPIKMGWMQGSPPPQDKQLTFADGSFFAFPALRWSASNMRLFMPTVNVSRGIGNPQPLPYRLDSTIDAVQFIPLNSTTPMTWEESLWENYTDGILILHKGTVVYERYFGALTENGQHAAMSVTKSITGILAASYVADGLLDDSKLVREYLPELSNSAYGDATVRQVLDMTTALQFSEEYANPNAEIWAFSEAGWLVERVGGKPLNELLADKIWRKIGMEQDAYFSVDELGTAFAGGGFNAGLRYFARLGELIRNDGVWHGEQVIPRQAVRDIAQGGNKQVFSKSGLIALAGWSYRNMWWHTVEGNHAQ
ncbi:MAG TPA: serine hydrolase [Aliidiomarina sp.]|nr:serine hydrolase [Aliidiomarina sp.]